MYSLLVRVLIGHKETLWQLWQVSILCGLRITSSLAFLASVGRTVAHQEHHVRRQSRVLHEWDAGSFQRSQVHHCHPLCQEYAHCRQVHVTRQVASRCQVATLQPHWPTVPKWLLIPLTSRIDDVMLGLLIQLTDTRSSLCGNLPGSPTISREHWSRGVWWRNLLIAFCRWLYICMWIVYVTCI